MAGVHFPRTCTIGTCSSTTGKPNPRSTYFATLFVVILLSYGDCGDDQQPRFFLQRHDHAEGTPIDRLPANRVVPGLRVDIADLLPFLLPSVPQHVEHLRPSNLSLRWSLPDMDRIEKAPLSSASRMRPHNRSIFGGAFRSVI